MKNKSKNFTTFLSISAILDRQLLYKLGNKFCADYSLGYPPVKRDWCGLLCITCPLTDWHRNRIRREFTGTWTINQWFTYTAVEVFNWRSQELNWDCGNIWLRVDLVQTIFLFQDFGRFFYAREVKDTINVNYK